MEKKAMTPQAEANRAAIEAALEAGLAAYNGVPDSHSQNVANVVRAAITAYQAALRALSPAAAMEDSATVKRVAAEKALREIHKLAVHRGTFASVDTRMEHAEHALSRIATLSTPTGKYAIVKGE